MTQPRSQLADPSQAGTSLCVNLCRCGLDEFLDKRFEQRKSYFEARIFESMVANLFSVRNAVDPAEAHRTFRGRDAEIAPLLRARGFPVPEGKAVGK